MPNLTAGKGSKVAEETQAKRGSAARLDQLRFGNNVREFFRFVTEEEEMVTADIHRFLPVLTKPPAEMVAKAAENKKEVKWPSGMWAVCQDDRIFLNTGPDGEPVKGEYEPGYGQCRVKSIFAGQKDDYKKDRTRPDRLTYALVVLQEATYDGQNLKGLTDKTEKWTDKEGAEYTVPAVRYMAQLYRNVYSKILNAVALAGGNPYGRSFMIRREDTEYNVAMVPSTMPGATATGDELAAYAKTLDLMGFSLGDFIIDHSSDEHYDRFWGDGSGSPAPSQGGDGAASAPEPDAAPGVPLNPEAQTSLDAFQAKLNGNAAKAGSTPAEESVSA